MLKQIFVPAALFALSATGASAYTGNTAMLENLNLGLSQTQISALEQAHDVRSTSRESAKKILQDAGIDKTKMKEIRTALRTEIKSHRQAVKTAVKDNDYAAFQTAVAGTKMADKITTEADFEKLVQARSMLKSGDRTGAEQIFTELGFPKIANRIANPGMHHGFRAGAQTNQ